MGRFDLNLSTRPFPAYRATNVALSAFLVILVVISIWQAYSFFRYSALAAEIRDEERDATVAAEVLKTRLQELENRLDRPEAAAKLTEIDYLNGLIARRHLSWTRILATLEDLVPDSVHLTSLGPQFGDDGTMLFRIESRARNIADIGRFIESLEESPVFNEVTVSSEQAPETDTSDDIEVTLAVTYLPEGRNAMMYRRQKQQYLFAGVLAVIALINVLFFFILHRPVRTEYARLQASIATLRAEGTFRQQSIARLEKTSEQLERFEQDRRQLFTNHFIQREAGFAAILPELDAMARRAGVTKSRVDYSSEAVLTYPLESVKIIIPVEGGYSSVVRFIRELETSNTLYLINSIDVRSVENKNAVVAGAPPFAGAANATATNIELALSLETFFYR